MGRASFEPNPAPMGLDPGRIASLSRALARTAETDELAVPAGSNQEPFWRSGAPQLTHTHRWRRHVRASCGTGRVRAVGEVSGSPTASSRGRQLSSMAATARSASVVIGLLGCGVLVAICSLPAPFGYTAFPLPMPAGAAASPVSVGVAVVSAAGPSTAAEASQEG